MYIFRNIWHVDNCVLDSCYTGMYHNWNFQEHFRLELKDVNRACCWSWHHGLGLCRAWLGARQHKGHTPQLLEQAKQLMLNNALISCTQWPLCSFPPVTSPGQAHLSNRLHGLQKWFSTFLKLPPFNTVPQVAVTLPTIKLFFHYFKTVMWRFLSIVNICYSTPETLQPTG